MRNWDASPLESGHIEYCRKHVLAAEICLRDELNAGKKDHTGDDDLFAGISKDDQGQHIKVLLSKLDEHARRILVVEHEYPRVAQYLTCVFISQTPHTRKERVGRPRTFSVTGQQSDLEKQAT